jgi:2,5-diketo-D-gluconate reductase A
MPIIGLGSLRYDDARDPRDLPAVIEAGYRLIDTAERYGNEEVVGRGIRAARVDRSELFLATKFNVKWHGRDLVRQAWEGSARRLGVDYIDLFMIHWPNPHEDRYIDAWEGMAALLDEGRVRAIGGSNFRPEYLERMRTEVGVEADVNQIQINPAVNRLAWRAYNRDHGIATEAWGPLGQAKAWAPAGSPGAFMSDPVLLDLADRYGKSVTQIVLRWHVEQSIVPIPGSETVDQALANLDIFDFSLAPDEVAAIASLDQGTAAMATDPEVFGH